MSIEGYIDYQRREFCKNMQCPVQMDLDGEQQGLDVYEKIRQACKTDCRYNAYQFHHWLINKAYLIVRPK